MVTQQAPQPLNYRPKLNWRPMRPNPRMWLHQYQVPSVDRTVDRSIAKYLPTAALDQGAEGSCTANSMANGLWASARIAGRNDPLISRMQDYYLSRVKEGSFPQDAGAGTDDSAGVAIDNGGLVAESTWPYDAQPAEKPAAAVASAPKFLSISQYQPIAAAQWLDGALSALDAGHPTLFAMAWYNSWFQDFQNTGILGAMNGGLAGYHQVIIGGWNGKQQLVRLRNSWGATSPARTDLLTDSITGDFWMPASAFTNGSVQELVALIPAGVAPNPQPNPPPPGNLVVSAGGPYAGTIGQTLTDLHCTAAVSGGTPPYTYTWLIAGMVYGNTNPLQNLGVIRNAGTYTVVCSVTDSAGNKADSPQTMLTVSTKPTPPPSGDVPVSILMQSGKVFKVTA